MNSQFNAVNISGGQWKVITNFPKGDKGDPGDPLTWSDMSNLEKQELVDDVVADSAIQTVIGEAEAAATLATTKAGEAEAAAQNADEAVAGIPDLVDTQIEAKAVMIENVALASSISKTGVNALILAASDDTPNGDGGESQFIRQNNKLFYLVSVEQA